MIEVRNISKRYGKSMAISDISFNVRRGEIVGLLGPNGAGKTTTMRILSCFLTATSGAVAIGGMDVGCQSLQVRRITGYLPENSALYPDMRVREFLWFRAGLKGLGGRVRRTRVNEVLEQFDLQEVTRKLIGSLSKGYQQRVGLADCLVHDPQVLLLDEPTVGLDPIQVRNVRNLIRGLAERHTIVLSTHMLSEVEATCHRVLILNRGRVVASDTPEQLAGRLKGAAQYTAEIAGPAGLVSERLRALPCVVSVTDHQDGTWHRFVIETSGADDIRESIFEAVVRNGWSLRELRIERKSLEDVFVAVTNEVNAS